MTKPFYHLDNLTLALNFAKDSAKRFFIPDFFRHQDFVHSSQAILEDISVRIQNKQYKPHPILCLDVPKSGLTTRPGSLVEFADFIVLFAAICSFVEDLDNKLPDNVHSARLNPRYKALGEPLLVDREILLLPIKERKELKWFEEWYEAWPKFDKETKSIVDSEEFDFLVVSDITAYYENINHDILRKILIQEHHDCYAINLLMEFLREWTSPLPDGYKVGRGIPQGNAVSSFLGNIYLLSLDRVLLEYEKRGEIKYQRYMDDVKIFAKTHQIAKKVLFKMNETLRELQLNIQGSKTDIYTRDEFKKFLIDEDMDQLHILVEEILAKERNKKIDFKSFTPVYYKKLKDFSLRLGRGKIAKDNIRFFKRLITGFTHIVKPDMTRRCFGALDDNPVLTDKIAQYFKRFIGGTKIPKRIVTMILSGDLFDYQVAKLIEIFWYKNEIPNGLDNLLLQYANDKSKSWATRMNSLIALSFFELDVHKRTKIQQLFKGETNYKVKKAIILCLLQAPPRVRDAILDYGTYDTDYRVNLFAKYLRDILRNSQVQKYELKNLQRLPSMLFVEESYKILLLCDSKDLSVLKGLQKLLLNKMKQKRVLPIHIRKRIARCYQLAKQNIHSGEDSKNII